MTRFVCMIITKIALGVNKRFIQWIAEIKCFVVITLSMNMNMCVRT